MKVPAIHPNKTRRIFCPNCEAPGIPRSNGMWLYGADYACGSVQYHDQLEVSPECHAARSTKIICQEQTLARENEARLRSKSK